MAVQILAGLARVGATAGRAAATGARAGARAAARGTKKLAVRKAKSTAKDKLKGKAKDLRYRQRNFKPGEGGTDSGERHLQAFRDFYGLSSPSPLIGGTTNPSKIKPAKSSDPQVKQLKVNVTNIHRFLVKSNNDYARQQATTRRNQTVQRSKAKLGGEEKKLGKGSSPLAKSASIVKGAMQPAGSLFDRIMEFAGTLLLGILVNALPAIVEKVKEVIDNLVNFFTPIQSGFRVIMSLFSDDINQDQLDVDKKRFDDGIQNIQGEGGLLDKIKEKLGPFGGAIDLLKGAIDKFRDVLGLKKASTKMKLEKRDGKEGFVNTETGQFTERQFTSAERKQYESGSTGSGGGGSTDISGIGDGREDMPVPLSGGILEGARKIIGMGKGTADQCANTTRAALREAGHPMADVRTMIGDLDTPQGIAYNAPSFAASFGGSDMGQVIKTKSNIKAGDIILWRADRDLGGILNKGAITHVGIAADDGLKHQFDHNRRSGFHYRRHWSSSGGTSWFAGIRLGSGRGSSKMKKASLSTNTQGSGDARASISNPENKTKVNQIASINQSMDDEGTTTIAVQQVNTIQTQVVPTPVKVASAPPQPAPVSQLTSIWTF
tara:strand:- start:197 stop:2011 length:1815 start_codon:yes stop_codon:yes gene_type:complete